MPKKLEDALQAQFQEISLAFAEKDLSAAQSRLEDVINIARVFDYPEMVYLGEYLYWVADNLEGLKKLSKDDEANRLMKTISEFATSISREFFGREADFLQKRLNEMVSLRASATRVQARLHDVQDELSWLRWGADQ